MVVVDPMHNLYLGTAKHILKNVWHNKNMINKKNYESLQQCVDSVHAPPNLGRLPSKILSSFAGLTADQLKNWTNIYSLFALHDCLPSDDFECWRHFILASRILTQMQLSTSDIQLAHALLTQFCKRVQRMYGSSTITPNMHLHCHLKDSLVDYGPVYNFWLFSFERYNGILQNFPSSTRSLEIQLMQRFMNEFSLSSFGLPEAFQTDFSHVLDTLSTPVVQGSLKSTLHGVVYQPGSLQVIRDWSCSAIDSEVKKPSTYILSVFNTQQTAELQSLLLLLYPHIPSTDININATFRKYTTLEYSGNRYFSCAYKSGSQDNCITLAQHCFNTAQSTVRPVLIHYFVYMSFCHQETTSHHIFVYVSWLHEHTEKGVYGRPLELWWKDLYENDMLSFIPLQCLIGNCAYKDTKFEEQTLLLICPTKNIKLV